MDLQKNELIEKLKKISAVYSDTVAIQSEMDEFEPEDHYERKVIVPKFPGDFQTEEEREIWRDRLDHTDEGAPMVAELTHQKLYGPKEPEKPKIGDCPKPEPALVNELKKKLGCLPLVAGFVAVCSLISGGLFAGDTLTAVLNIVILVACAGAGFFYYKKYKSAEKGDQEVAELTIKTYEENKKEAEEKYEQDMKVYQSRLTAYEKTKTAFLKEYTAWREIYLTHLDEEDEIEERLEADRAAAVKKIYEEKYVPAQNKLEDYNDLVSAEYLPVLGTIIDLIKSGRADGFKEAINLYEDIVYRERQLEQERQAEENRQREAQQQMQMQAQQHAEQMKFQQEQERQRKREAEQQLRMQEQQHKDEMKMQEARLKQERDIANASRQKRCVWCAHKSTCREQYYDGAYNCTGFTPKK